MTMKPVSSTPHLDRRSIRDALTRRAFENDAIRLQTKSLAGATHLVASRRGLYAVNETEWTLLSPGFFFGLTIANSAIYAFEASNIPQNEPWTGARIIRLTRNEDRIVDTAVVAKDLDNGCHQIDLLEGRLHVVDTYRQRILRYTKDFSSFDVLTPLPLHPRGRWLNLEPGYVHVNSILQVGDRILLLLHNFSSHTDKPSEIAVYNTNWEEQERWTLNGRSCHGLALLEDGRILTCDSEAGDVIDLQGFRVHITEHMTRGLAIGADSIVVGGSPVAQRESRHTSDGTVTFLNRDLSICSVLNVPGAPTEIRRLDGQDHGLSGFLRDQPWGRTFSGLSGGKS